MSWLDSGFHFDIAAVALVIVVGLLIGPARISRWLEGRLDDDRD